MKTLNLKTLLLMSLFTALPLSSALAVGGSTGGTGGGNSVNHKLVEDYALDLSQVKGRDEFEQKLKMLEKELPVFGKEVREHFENMTFYVIPRSLKELPEEQTGLHFRNEQAAIQENNEVFIDKEIFDKWGPIEAAKLYMHEAIMNLTSEKRSADTRKVVAKIFDKSATPEQIQRTLVGSHFGVNLTRSQLDQMLGMSQKTYEERLVKATSLAEDSCARKDSPEEILKWLNAEDAISQRPAQSCTYRIDGSDCEKFQAPFQLHQDAFNFESALTPPWLWSIASDGKAIYNFQERTIQQLSAAIPPVNPEVVNELIRLQQIDPNFEKDLRKQLNDANIYKATYRFDGYVKTFANMARQPAYTNILAIDALLNRRFETDSMKKDLRNGFGSTSLQDVRKMHQAVYTRSKDLASYPPEKIRELLCNSVSVVKKEIKRMKDSPASLNTSRDDGKILPPGSFEAK